MSEPHVRQLQCGMPLIVERLAGVQSAGLCWLIGGGSSRDPQERRGLSAMWAELLHRGAGDLDSRAHADALDTLGVSRGVDVGTHFLSLTGSMLGERVLDALPLLVDMVIRPRFDADDIEPTRDLCLQSLDALGDDPQRRAMIRLKERRLPSPLNRSGMGTIEGLRQLDADDVRDGWSQRALPETSILALAGDVDAGAVESRLNELLADWRGGADAVAVTAPALRGVSHESDPTNQVQIGVGYDAPCERDESSMLERIVTAALSGGMSGRLFTEVREKRALCYSVYASYRSDRDFGGAIAYAGTTPARAQETLDVLVGELRRINGGAASGGGLTESEFKRAVVGLKSKLVMSGESTGARAAALAGDHWLIERPRSLDEIAKRIDAVTLDEVNAYLSRRELGDLTIVTIGPEELKAPM